MRRSEYGIALNWNYAILSIVVVTILLLIVLYLPGIRTFDWNVLHAVRQVLAPYPLYIPQFLSEFGRGYYMIWPQITACAVLVSHKMTLKAFLVVFFTHATFLANELMKNFVCRERPCSDMYGGYSFPSGHSSTTMCFYGIMTYLVMRYVKEGFWKYFLITLFGLWIFLCGLSRMWLAAHFLTDVIAGMFLGFLFVNLYIIVSRALEG